MSAQANLFSEPEQRADASQWWTPMWFALRMAAWVPRTAHVPRRVKYGGKHSASFDSQVLKIERRADLRAPGELTAVIEEVWREGE